MSIQKINKQLEISDTNMTLDNVALISKIISPRWVYSHNDGLPKWHYIFHIDSTGGWGEKVIIFSCQSYNRKSYAIGYISYYNDEHIYTDMIKLDDYSQLGFIKNNDNSIDVFYKPLNIYQPTYISVLSAIKTRELWFDPYKNGEYPKICDDSEIINKINSFSVHDFTDSLYREMDSFGPNFEPYGGNFRAVRCRKVNGVVYLKGLLNVKSDLQNSEDVICTLPTGFRPSTTVYVNACSSSGEYNYGMHTCPITIRSDGTIRLHNGHVRGWLSLDGISYFQD